MTTGEESSRSCHWRGRPFRRSPIGSRRRAGDPSTIEGSFSERAARTSSFAALRAAASERGPRQTRLSQIVPISKLPPGPVAIEFELEAAPVPTLPIVALPLLVAETVKKRYQDLGLPDSLWSYYDGLRPNDIQAPMAYKARPLNGIWATAPFLHNGSVRTMRELLLPADQREKSFRVGTRAFDPVDMGFKNEGASTLDTSLPGNSNAGHDGPKYGNAELAEDKERMDALLEYLKTL